MIFIFIVFTFLFYIGQFIERLSSKYIAYLFNTILFIFLAFCFTSYTNNSDWNMYYYFFKYEEDKTDPVFYWLTMIFKKFHLNYTDLYRFHIVLIILLYYFLVSKFTKNIFYIFLAYLMLDNVHLVNQIRYYMGYPILMSGFYFLFIRKQYLLAIALIVFALLCHSGLSFMLIFIPIYFFIPLKKYIQYTLILSVIIFVISLFIFNSSLGTILSHFGNYFQKDNQSSFLGGLYNGIPYLIFTVFLLIQTFKLLRDNPNVIEDPKFVFLYKLSFLGIIFIPASFIIQIIGHRYVMTLSIFWLIYYYLFFIKDQDAKLQFPRFSLVSGIILISSIFIYIIPYYLFGHSHFAEEFLNIIKSSHTLEKFLD